SQRPGQCPDLRARIARPRGLAEADCRPAEHQQSRRSVDSVGDCVSDRRHGGRLARRARPVTAAREEQVTTETAKCSAALLTALFAAIKHGHRLRTNTESFIEAMELGWFADYKIKDRVSDLGL